MAILVMLNNYMHDLATAVFAVCAVTAWLLHRSGAMREAPEAVRPIAAGVVRVGVVALVWTLAAGVLRGLTYYEYEYVVAWGRAQVPVLILKHLILVSLVSVGAFVLYRVRRLSRSAAGPGP